MYDCNGSDIKRPTCACYDDADDGCDLQSLGLGGNGITAKGMKDLSRSLWNNTRLESVGLGGNYLG